MIFPILNGCSSESDMYPHLHFSSCVIFFSCFLKKSTLGVTLSINESICFPTDVKPYAGKSKCDFLVLSGDKWREKKFLLSDKSA